MIPLPDDVAGILGGIMEYDLKKFLVAATIGKVVLSTAIAWGGFYGTFLLGGSQNVILLSLIGLFVVILFNIVRVARKKLRRRNSETL